MAKRRRSTGIPSDHAAIGTILPHLKRYTGHQCDGCSLNGVCLDPAPPGGPWEVIGARPDEATECRVNPNITMVPVDVLRIKEARKETVAPQQAAKDTWHVLLDANAVIEGAKGTYPGIINLILEPPTGFHFYTTDQVADEIKFLKNHDRGVIFDNIEVVPAPREVDERITETRARSVNPPSPTDQGLFQLALDDPKYDMLVSSDRFHAWTALPQTLGIADRFRVYKVEDFVRYAKRRA